MGKYKYRAIVFLWPKYISNHNSLMSRRHAAKGDTARERRGNAREGIVREIIIRGMSRGNVRFPPAIASEGPAMHFN